MTIQEAARIIAKRVAVEEDRLKKANASEKECLQRSIEVGIELAEQLKAKGCDELTFAAAWMVAYKDSQAN